MMVVIDINAHKLADPSCSAQLSELCNKSGGIPGKSNDCAVHVDDESMRAVDLSPSRQADIYKKQGLSALATHEGSNGTFYS